MFDPKENDFATLAAWGLAQDPLKAIKDFSPLKLELRWVNPYQREAYLDYFKKREAYIQKENFDAYYKKAEKPIDRRRWEYIKDRKAWYILPLEWQRFAEKGVTRILDLGCGDGDVTQRIADFIIKTWKDQGYKGHKIEIYGYDLNASRIKNAQQLCTSSHPDITFHFEVCDVVGKGIQQADQFFDYVAVTGVFEILEDKPADIFMKETCRVAAKGVYVEDLADEFPGGYPRETFHAWFEKYGLSLEHHHWVFTEPFVVEGSMDPMKLWPNLKDQVMFAVRK